jgi:hypothetical protein
MNKKILSSLLLLLALAYSCAKCPTSDELQGTWLEQSDNPTKTKLIFQGNNLLYYFHPPAIDTLSYTLDKKHNTMFLTFYRNPNNITPTGYTTVYHKRKKVLTITGLLPDVLGRPSVVNYKQ